MPEDTKDFYDKDYYYGCRSSNYVSYDAYDNDRFWRPVVAVLKKHGAQGRILDIGCAFGFFLKRAAPLFQEVYGVDVSSFAIEQAKRHLLSARFEVVDLDTAELPFADGFFDVITAFETLEHTASIPVSLRKISSKLKKGGYFIFSVPVRDTLAGKLFGYIDKDSSHVSVPKVAELFEMVRESGFTVLKTRTFLDVSYFRIPGIAASYEFILQK